MKKSPYILSVLAMLLGASLAFTQQPPAAGKGKGKGPPPPMSFFVSSVGVGKGADLGGLAGADMHCQTLAAAAPGTPISAPRVRAQSTRAIASGRVPGPTPKAR